eukprot:s637_g28.t1
MIRVYRASGDQALALPVEEFQRMAQDVLPRPPVHVLKRQLQKVSGASRFQHRLLRESGQLLCDETRLEEPVDLHLVVLPFAPVGSAAACHFLQLAREHRHREMEALLQIPQDPDLVDDSGTTALALSVRHGAKATVALLLEAMADTEKRSHAGETALSAALLWEHWEVARLLMDAGAEKEEALCLACARGQAAAVQFLLDAETDIEQGNSMGETPLFLALLHGHWEVTCLLMDAGCVKERALWLAAARGHGNVVRLLLDAGVDIDKPNSDGEAPLFLALLHDHWEVACLLMDAGADKEKVLSYVASQNFFELAFLLRMWTKPASFFSQEGRPHPSFEAKVPREDAGLTATGRWQAEQLRLRLEAAQQEGSLPTVSRVACSPLRRARETAATLFPNHEVQILDDLAERHEGPAVGAETLQQLALRADRCFEWLVECEEDSIAVVSHGELLRLLFTRMPRRARVTVDDRRGLSVGFQLCELRACLLQFEAQGPLTCVVLPLRLKP